jgi:hypothetical protein
MKTTLSLWTWRPLRFLRFSGLWIMLFLSSGAQAHVLAEILKRPTAFDQQTVIVTGQVEEVTTRYGEAVSTTFAILDDQGASLAVLVSGIPECKQGEICRISGLFVAQRNLLLPEKIERVAERPSGNAGVLFHQRSAGGPVSGGKSLRGVYIPQ